MERIAGASTRQPYLINIVLTFSFADLFSPAVAAT